MKSLQQPLPAKCLTSAIPGWFNDNHFKALTRGGRHVIGVLPGEGIGPEVVSAAVEVLKAVGQVASCDLEFRYGGPIGKEAEQLYGKSLTPDVEAFCQSVFADGGAMLCGPGGSRFVYELRERFDLFCKFTPIKPTPSQLQSGIIRADALQNVDMVVVRENTGGVYFGQWGRNREQDGDAFHTFGYTRNQVRRILTVAGKLASQRRGRLTVAVKPAGLPSISELWLQQLEEIRADYDLSTRMLEVDTASFQIVASAADFDVVVAPNMLGDILADGAALLLGSRGLTYSGNFGSSRRAVFQTGHGAAYDLAGQDRANPIGQIFSAAMLIRESFALYREADAVESAVESTLSQRVRTADMAVRGSSVIGTCEMGRRIADAVLRSY